MSKQPIEPDLFDNFEEDPAGGSDAAAYSPPEEPMGAQTYGTTASEERAGETFGQRDKHTNPDVFDEALRETSAPIGRLVQPGDEEVDLTDNEANTVAWDTGEDDGDLSAEESAMHSTDL